MPNPRLSTILVAICLLAYSFSNGLLPLAQAVNIAPAVDSPAVYDATNSAEPVLQKAEEVLPGLPVDRRGAVDWMKALNSGVITPRADLSGTGNMEIFDADIIMKNTKSMPYVKFPHSSHTKWLTCVNCHGEIFVPMAGGNPINMTKIFQGEYCGVCHGKVAFTATFSCERCHSVTHGFPKVWWKPQ